MQKIRIKLYKSGKLWVAAAVAATGMAVGLGLTPVSADETAVTEPGEATVVTGEVTAPKATGEVTPVEAETENAETAATASTEGTKAEAKTAKDTTAKTVAEPTTANGQTGTTTTTSTPEKTADTDSGVSTQPDENGRNVPTINTEFNNVVLTKPEDGKKFASTIKNTVVTKKMDIMFVLDSTGSMGRVINWLNEGLTDFVSALTAAGATEINIGVVSYGDADYDGTKWYNVELGLAANPVERIKTILSGTYTHTGGNDPQEDTISAIMKTATETGWREDSTKWIINTTDHASKERETANYDGQSATYDGMKALLDSKGIQLFALQTNDNDPKMKSLATKTFVVHSLNDASIALDGTIKAPVGDATKYTYTVKVTSKYASDGKTSTDVVVTPDKSTIVLNAGESGAFNFSTLIKDNPARYGDKTIVTIEYFADGVLVPSKTQKLEYTPEKSAELPGTDGSNTPKPKPTPKPTPTPTPTPTPVTPTQTTTPAAKVTLPQTGEKSSTSLVALGFSLIAGIGGLALYNLKKRQAH